MAVPSSISYGSVYCTQPDLAAPPKEATATLSPKVRESPLHAPQLLPRRRHLLCLAHLEKTAMVTVSDRMPTVQVPCEMWSIKSMPAGPDYCFGSAILCRFKREYSECVYRE